jgi:hypothetical protein
VNQHTATKGSRKCWPIQGCRQQVKRAVSQPTPAGSSLETAAEPASRHPEAVTKSVSSPPDRHPAAGLLWVGGFRSWPGFDPDTDLSRPPVPPLSDEGHLVDPRRVGRPPCFAGNQGVPNLVRCPDGVRRLLVMAQNSQRSRDAFPPTEAGNDCRLRIRLCLTLKPFDSLRVRSRPPSPRASFPTLGNRRKHMISGGCVPSSEVESVANQLESH